MSLILSPGKESAFKLAGTLWLIADFGLMHGIRGVMHGIDQFQTAAAWDVICVRFARCFRDLLCTFLLEMARKGGPSMRVLFNGAKA